MGLGVLQDKKLEHVPGTNRLFDAAGKEPVRRVPEPSDDPNDPLNWSLARRDTILFILSFAAVMTSALTPILAANTLTLSLHFGRDFTAIALLTGYHLCGVGIAGIVFVPSARVWGKRHAYLIGTILSIVSSVWGGASKSYKSLLWARIIQGFAVAPFESLINVTVADMYFVHERGKRMALTSLAVFGGSFFTPVVVGKITYTIGWEWTFYFVAIFSALALPFVFFFCPETAFVRPDYLNTDLASTENLNRSRTISDTTNGSTSTATHNNDKDLEAEAMETSPAASVNHEQGADATIAAEKQTKPSQERASFRAQLAPFNGRKTNESYLKLLVRPFPLFLHPAVLWGCLIQGTLIGWTVLIGVVLAAIFLSPPLFFNEVQTGYMYSGPFIGAILGFVVAGLLADWSAAYMTKRNGGVYEPEFRIVLVALQLVFGAVGLYGFGITSADPYKYHWFPAEFFFSCEVFAMVVGAVASSTYLADAHRDFAIESFTCLLIFKNLFSFGLTWKAYDWIVHHGIKGTFIIIATVQVIICLTSIPMYIFGMKNRSFFHRHDIFRLFHLD